MGQLQRAPGTAPTAFSQDLPWLRRRERSSLVKHRMRETCTSGSVRGEGGNILTYSAFDLAQCGEEGLEGSGLGEGGLVGEELQSPGLVGGVQPIEEQATEEPGEDRNGEEEAGPAGDPVLAIGRDAASRDDDVDMRMVGECRSPGVEHGGESDAGAEVLGVGGDGDQGLGGGFEQQVI